MNILIITSFLPYPINSGGAQGVFNITDALRNRHNITMFCLENQDNRKSSLSNLMKVWPDVHFYIFPYWKQLLSISFIKQKAVKVLHRLLYRDPNKQNLVRVKEKYTTPLPHTLFSLYINNIIKKTKPDIIQVEFFPLINVIDYINTDIPVLFVHHEIRFVVNNRMVDKIEKDKKSEEILLERKNEELKYLNKYNSIITVTEKDKDVLGRNGVIVPIYSSSLAVNTPVFPYNAWNETIIYIGGYGHYPNKEGLDWFLNIVAPIIDWSRYKRIRLIIIGKGWPNVYNKIYGNGLDVQCAGFVENLSEIAYGGIMVVPLLTGSGMRMKILDAAALSIPFVTTSVGVEGLEFKHDESCLIADSPELFAKELVRLMDEEKLRKRLSQCAQEIYKECYSVDASACRRLAVYKKVLSKK